MNSSFYCNLFDLNVFEIMTFLIETLTFIHFLLPIKAFLSLHLSLLRCAYFLHCLDGSKTSVFDVPSLCYRLPQFHVCRESDQLRVCSLFDWIRLCSTTPGLPHRNQKLYPSTQNDKIWLNFYPIVKWSINWRREQGDLLDLTIEFDIVSWWRKANVIHNNSFSNQVI